MAPLATSERLTWQTHWSQPRRPVVPTMRAEDRGYSNRAARTIARRRTANYLLSIQQDVDFATKARAVRPWPCLANLRAGAWYMSPGLLDGTSYFKSMDGHRNAWDFSLIRLNLHVARMAAGAGGVILVDCTGNRRQDRNLVGDDPNQSRCLPAAEANLPRSKTVPIWCAVLQAAMDEAVEFDDLLHLPSDVKEERLEILKRMPQWVEMLRQALPAAELKDLAQQLYGKRLRACWVCPSDDLEQMSAVPRLQWLLLCLGMHDYSWPEDLKNLEKDFVLILCVSVSKVEMGSTSYVQGAGDDEEAWAQQLGLTPELFWKHV
eukprot:s1449_g12.t1